MTFLEANPPGESDGVASSGGGGSAVSKPSVETSAQEFLSTLVTCERHVSLFPSGIPVRACLRRQVERQRGAKPGTLGPPTKPHCTTCALGIEIATSAASIGVAAIPCPACGAALIGGATCENCATAAAEKAPAKGFLPPTGAPVSSRIWGKDAPDAPIGRPPGSPTVGEEAAARMRKPAAAPWAAQGTRKLRDDVNQEPAQPAEERAMACSECGSKTCHKATCSKRPTARAALPKLPPKPRAAKRETKTLVRVASHKLFDVKEASAEQLVETIGACSAELAARRTQRGERSPRWLNQVAEAIGGAA